MVVALTLPSKNVMTLKALFQTHTLGPNPAILHIPLTSVDAVLLFPVLLFAVLLLVVLASPVQLM
ncbi:hypothetical protein AO278_26515 [Pseudomonas syringae pv. syringae]|nr:hypothetical protein AO278_26515 [Pseudomonas syringae pv. syringae]